MFHLKCIFHTKQKKKKKKQEKNKKNERTPSPPWKQYATEIKKQKNLFLEKKKNDSEK